MQLKWKEMLKMETLGKKILAGGWRMSGGIKERTRAKDAGRQKGLTSFSPPSSLPLNTYRYPY